MYADSLAFLAPLAKFGFADRNLLLDLAHITVAPPNVYSEKSIVWWVRAVKAFMGIQRQLHLIQSRAELSQHRAKHHTALLFGLQHPPAGGKLERIARLGVRVTTIGYETESEYGSGFANPKQGLTEKGKALLEEIARCGMILDLSHASHQMARDALEYREARGLPLKVMASHTGCFEVYAHPRNLPLDVFKGIKAADGYVGIYTLTFGLHDSDNSPCAFQRHLDFALCHLGYTHVGIGSDGVHKRMDLKARQAQFARMDKKLVAATNFRPRDPIEPEDFIGPDKFRCIEHYLTRSFPYSREMLEGVMGKNFHHFLAQALS